MPDFAQHRDEAWGVANVAVKIGAIRTYGNPVVDDFNVLVMDLVNLASGNVLQQGNVSDVECLVRCAHQRR